MFALSHYLRPVIEIWIIVSAMFWLFLPADLEFHSSISYEILALEYGKAGCRKPSFLQVLFISNGIASIACIMIYEIYEI